MPKFFLLSHLHFIMLPLERIIRFVSGIDIQVIVLSLLILACCNSTIDQLYFLNLGHLIHRIPNQHTICRGMVFLEPFILVTVRDNELIIWDCNDARSICIVPLASHTTDIDSSAWNSMLMNNNDNKWTKSSIKNLMFSYEQKALICDYGNSLCVINNPFATRKID